MIFGDYVNRFTCTHVVKYRHKVKEINTSRLRNDNNNAQTKYTHGVAVKPEPQKVKERVMEEVEKRSLKGLVFII